eukprot:SM000006S19444  [mRNA]  locus=s6:741041:749189:- [translate_table: standard]
MADPPERTGGNSPNRQAPPGGYRALSSGMVRSGLTVLAQPRGDGSVVRMSDTTVHFSVLCDMMDAVVRNRKPLIKRKHLATFLDHVYTDHEFFSAMRLILPELDRERATYGLKEAVLAKHLTDALGLGKESEDAKKLLEWKTGGKRAGANAGKFPLVASEVLQRRQREVSAGITIREVNDLLDKLAAGESREEKIAVLTELISETNVREMKWLICIILKDLKLGVSEKTVFSEFHPDAEDLFNVTCDLKLVCQKLSDRSIRYKRQDIEVGKAVRPQLAARVDTSEAAWKKMKGKAVIVECKFDGDRIQIHKDGEIVYFFSRTFIDHTEYKEAISDLIVSNVLQEKCILDGEMLVFDRSTNRFADFGANQEADVAFDVLYVDGGSVIHQALHERQQLLEASVKPIKGRLEVLTPSSGLNQLRQPGEPVWSTIATSETEVEHFFLETVDNRDEGVLLKDMESKWEPGDRSGKWLKIKPDYVNVESDLDALIIGGYYGKGGRGGKVSNFLLGLAEKHPAGGNPTRFISFCRVGTGFSNEELGELRQKLEPFWRPNARGTKAPSFYTVTNHSKERPDLWIDQPEKSVILQIKSDIRTIRSEVFATPYSLRFPRVQKIRYDKPWYDCLDKDALYEIVTGRGGQTVDGKRYSALELRQPKRQKKGGAAVSAIRPLLPQHLTTTDVSEVQRKSDLFGGLIIYFPNFSEDLSREKSHILITEHGATFSMSLSPLVTHTIAAEKRGIKYQAAAGCTDVIHYSWIMDCLHAQKLLPLKSKYYLHLSDATKAKLRDTMDASGDSYTDKLEQADLQQLLQAVDTIHISGAEVNACRSECCTDGLWYLFQGCHIYLLQAYGISYDNSYSFVDLCACVPKEISKYLRSRSVHIVKQSWIEDSVATGYRIKELDYNIRGDADVNADADLNVDGERKLTKSGDRLLPRAMRRRGRAQPIDKASKDEVLTTQSGKGQQAKRNVPDKKPTKRRRVQVMDQGRSDETERLEEKISLRKQPEPLPRESDSVSHVKVGINATRSKAWEQGEDGGRPIDAPQDRAAQETSHTGHVPDVQERTSQDLVIGQDRRTRAVDRHNTATDSMLSDFLGHGRPPQGYGISPTSEEGGPRFSDSDGKVSKVPLSIAAAHPNSVQKADSEVFSSPPSLGGTALESGSSAATPQSTEKKRVSYKSLADRYLGKQK